MTGKKQVAGLIPVLTNSWLVYSLRLVMDSIVSIIFIMRKQLFHLKNHNKLNRKFFRKVMLKAYIYINIIYI